MKKTLLRRGAVIAACAAAFVLVSCGETEFDGRQDTVYELDTPDVRAVAYPGVNFVSWEPVAGAANYEVKVYEEGVYKGPAKNINGNSCYDIDLTNGKTYTYYVEAKSNSNPAAKTVYALNSIGQASVEAIVPPAGTKALDLAAYEDGYDGETKTVSENDEWIVKSNNIKVAVVDNTVQVNFPMKAYLKYEVKCYKNDLPYEVIMSGDSVAITDTDKSDAAANNVLGGVTKTFEDAGKFKLVVVAKSYGFYQDSDEVPYGEITIDGLKLDNNNNIAATNQKAYYLYNDNKIANDVAVTGAKNAARISFIPATKDSIKVPTDWYKVYRRVDGEYTNTTLAAVEKDLVKGTYYVDDKVPDVTKKYVYTIAVTDGKKYGNSVKAELGRPGANELNGVGSFYLITRDVPNKTTTYAIDLTGDAIKATSLTAYYWSKPADWEENEVKTDKTLYDDIIKNGTTIKELPLSTTSSTESRKTYELKVETVTGKVYLLAKVERTGYNTEYKMTEVTIPSYN